jgi:membrane protease YdiL (CAAX protease family)
MNILATILVYTICYCVVFTITGVCKKNKSNRLFNSTGLPAANTGYLFALHIAGIFWLALVPMILLKQSTIAVAFNSQLPSMFWLILLLFFMLALANTGLSASRKIIIHHSNSSFTTIRFFDFYFIIRILFLCAYELFFRGFLLFDCKQWFGIVPAVMLSTVLTVLIHVFTNRKEMLACIPFGILLCIFCIVFNAVWPAITLHFALSLSFEIPPARHLLKQLKLIK